jgi:hypothetical protein
MYLLNPDDNLDLKILQIICKFWINLIIKFKKKSFINLFRKYKLFLNILINFHLIILKIMFFKTLLKQLY